MPTDEFGVTMLFPSVGRTWTSKWANGEPREVVRSNQDPLDGEFRLRGSKGTMWIDGAGIARVNGSPRMYVYEDKRTWGNVEITFYARRIAETKVNKNAGLVVGGRSEHQNYSEVPCNAHTYYAALLYDGRWVFKKELKHDSAPHMAANKPDDSRFPWAGGTIPCCQWINCKFLVRNCDGSTKVRLSAMVDLTNGSNGGNWTEHTLEATDAGDWRLDGIDCVKHPTDQVFRDAATLIFLRNDDIESVEYKWFSIREIAPLA